MNPQVRLQGPMGEVPMEEAPHLPRTRCAALPPPQAWENHNKPKKPVETKPQEADIEVDLRDSLLAHLDLTGTAARGSKLGKAWTVRWGVGSVGGWGAGGPRERRPSCFAGGTGW